MVPEWTLWMMEALEERGLAGSLFLWSDDNLSNRYLWNYLTEEQRLFMSRFPKYARVGCFKGFDEQSFSLNTSAEPSLFGRQFEIMRDLIREGFDVYAYATFTSEPHSNIAPAMSRFVDRLQELDVRLPLRTVPLKIEVLTPTKERVKTKHETALKVQHEAHDAWLSEIRKRFTEQEASAPINQIPLGRR